MGERICGVIKSSVFCSMGGSLIKFKGVKMVDEIERLMIDNFYQKALGTSKIE